MIEYAGLGVWVDNNVLICETKLMWLLLQTIIMGMSGEKIYLN
jgi:hypothetical protein